MQNKSFADVLSLDIVGNSDFWAKMDDEGRPILPAWIFYQEGSKTIPAWVTWAHEPHKFSGNSKYKDPEIPPGYPLPSQQCTVFFQDKTFWKYQSIATIRPSLDNITGRNMPAPRWSIVIDGHEHKLSEFIPSRKQPDNKGFANGPGAQYDPDYASRTRVHSNHRYQKPTNTGAKKSGGGPLRRRRNRAKPMDRDELLENLHQLSEGFGQLGQIQPSVAVQNQEQAPERVAVVNFDPVAAEINDAAGMINDQSFDVVTQDNPDLSNFTASVPVDPADEQAPDFINFDVAEPNVAMPAEMILATQELQ